MGASIKPELFASVKPLRGFISVKPELFASVKPLRGFISVKPELFAVIDCTPVARLEVTTADTKRVIVKTEIATADTLREIAKTESAVGDTLKIISAYEQTIADTLRIIMQGYKVDETTTADTLRRIKKNESTIADTLIRNLTSEIVTADTLRIINNVEIATADTLRRIVEIATADTCRVIFTKETAIADTIIRVPHILKYVIENNPVSFRGVKNLKNTPAYSLVNSFKDYGVTNVDITLNEKTLSDNFQFEITHPMEINDAVKGQLLDYYFNFLVEDTSQRDLTQSVKGMYNIDELLYTQIYIPTDITNNTEFTAPTDITNNTKFTASDFIKKIAKYLGLNIDIQMDDFTPYNDFSGSYVTYRDLLSSIFGWTSRLPHRQINIFIRGDNLHCIQRGKEISTFDISNLPHSRPTINKSLIRSLWNKPHNDDDDGDGEIPFSGTINYSTSKSTVRLVYSQGLLISETNKLKSTDNIAISTTNYSYTKFNDVDYISAKTTSASTEKTDGGVSEKIVDTTTISYVYKQGVGGAGAEAYLFSEYEDVSHIEYEKDLSEDVTYKLVESTTSIRQTMHTPIGNGWYAQTVYEDGQLMGSNISQGAPSNSVSLYTISSTRKSFGSQYGQNNSTYEDWRRRLSTIADISFPVRELELLKELTNEIFWLNRKIQKAVSVDLISPINNGVPTITHIVDFTERIILDGEEYFLVSNQIQFTPRKFIQKLNLIRWYAQ